MQKRLRAEKTKIPPLHGERRMAYTNTDNADALADSIERESRIDYRIDDDNENLEELVEENEKEMDELPADTEID